MLTLHYYSYDLKLSETFTVASNSRTCTEAIFVEIKYGDKIGYGQASFPPYMKEKREDNLVFLSKVKLDKFSSDSSINEIHQYLNSISPTNTPSKAAIDIALHDLQGKINGIPVYQLLELEYTSKVYTSYTIGIGDNDFILRQLQKAKDFKTLKVKLSGDTDYNKNAMSLIREFTAQPIAVDFNQGLVKKEEALVMLEWLCEKNVLFAEQPLPVSLEKDYKWLKENSPLDIYGDESIQNLDDVKSKSELFHGINVKLMKCGGISKAYKMAIEGKKLGLKLMLGCMTESVCAVMAAAHLAGLFSFADLDGHVLISNDLFSGDVIEKGEVIVSDKPGLGLKKI